MLNWNHVIANARTLKLNLRDKWSKLTDADWEALVPQTDQFIGCLQALYGLTAGEVLEELQRHLPRVATRTVMPA